MAEALYRKARMVGLHHYPIKEPPPSKSTFLKSLFYLKLHPDKSLTIADAARDAGIDKGTVGSWLNRDATLRREVDLMLAPSEPNYDPPITEAEEEMLREVTGWNSVWDRIEDASTDWPSFLDGLPNVILQWYADEMEMATPEEFDEFAVEWREAKAKGLAREAAESWSTPRPP